MDIMIKVMINNTEPIMIKNLNILFIIILFL